jgi:uncharacterized protein (TIGR03067 family)
VTRAALLALALTTAAVAAPVPKPLKAKPVSLNGEWEMVSEERDGTADVPRSSRYKSWRVSDGELVLMAEPGPQRDPVYRAKLTSEPGEGGRPWTFEYVGENGYHRRGVCELDGDTLKVSFAKDPKARPEKLTSEAGGYLYTFKRVTRE